LKFLTRVGQFSNETRQEFILLSDVLGLEMTVVELNHGTDADETEATLLGPFYVADAPELPKGAMVYGNPPGEPLDVMGEIQDPKGKPIANALIDVWQAGDDGLYSSQDPNKAKFELRGKFRSDRDGTYSFQVGTAQGLSDSDRWAGERADAYDGAVALAPSPSAFHDLSGGLQPADNPPLPQGCAASG
jgi:protocatechuate 3,4-dioxygenase beta subunit